MTPHDTLMCDFIRMQKLLEQYLAEFKPQGGEECETLLRRAMLLAHAFTESEHEVGQDG